MQKTLSILGSTGSIGRQTLEVAEHLGHRVLALSADKSIKLLEEQTRKYRPALVAVFDEKAAGEFESRISGTDTRVIRGMDGLIEAARESGADTVVTAIAGAAGLQPTLAALETGKRVAIANKEPLVCAGRLVMDTARKHGAEIIPVDSEHSAIFQCLHELRVTTAGSTSHDLSCAENIKTIKKIILTASGGPFRGKTRDELSKVTPEMALRHPNWSMGQKVTIDSATLMNKGLEIIEAVHLFNITPEQIEVVIHPESIIHSMVEFTDNTIIALLSNPDMRLPIQYALTYPDRMPSQIKALDITELKQLTFEKPDYDSFPCLRLAYKAAKSGDTACAALNKANEEAVDKFLKNETGFYGISDKIEEALKGNLCT